MPLPSPDLHRYRVQDDKNIHTLDHADEVHEESKSKGRRSLEFSFLVIANLAFLLMHV